MEPVSETNDETGGVDGVSEGEAAQRVKGFNVESSPNGANFDVVAVHGIHQSFRETWAGDEADNPTWLEAAFSSEPVRLMSYSYDSDEAAAKAYTYQGIYQHAEALLDGLAQQQTDAIAACMPKTPTLLVGHDVGGVIVKAVRSPNLFPG
ncbi:hypothetical protein DL98DRAFT_460390 [Cadophora sp. DSE1049]|nr:hypothetical protein DL98DRAFT_460390 [Cadophora sp. DSE1049]